MQDFPFLSVIVPVRNEGRFIAECLEGILEQDYPRDRLEVIVTDGRSDDGTPDIVARIAAGEARLRLVDNPNRTTPCGLNAGIRAARGEVIARMDAHTRYAPDYLRRCVEALHATQADNVGGPWVAEGRTYVQRAIAAAFASPFAVGGARGHDAGHEGPVDTVYLGCWPRDVFARIGLFDTELVRNQDDELNLRLLRSGGRIWQSARIHSWYTPRTSLANLFRQYFQYGYWKVRVIQKHGAPASFRHIVPGSFWAMLLLLSLLAPLMPFARLSLALLLLLYLGLLMAASLQTAARSDWTLLPLLPPVFGCYHLGYGLGFLLGIWDFVLRRRSGRCVALTRT